MMKKLITFLFFVGIYNSIIVASTELPNEADVVLCQDQAENYGNGKGDDIINQSCIESFKKMAAPEAKSESKSMKMKFFGYRNTVLIEKYKNNILFTEIIAGNSSELKAIRALTFDEKNQEVVVLDDSGDILFFSSKITGNIAPFRILKHKDLVGACELVVDSTRDQVVVNNKSTKRILFFSRLANFHAREGKQKLVILKSIDTSLIDLKNLSIDLEKSELHGVDSSKNSAIVFNLK
ncbi:MAG: hypothetical protein H7281_17760 [Bacteriovorax sp.]|nr:hypothetical protein [Bacteriovorax sp.]